MKTISLRTAAAALILALSLHCRAQATIVTKAGKTQFISRGQPMHILGGELSNSAATCTADARNLMPRMKALGLNTVLVPAQWDLIEPAEGHFDFTLTGHIIDKARENGLKLIFLWFGAWKNSMSCYAPLWFKEDAKRFPRAMTAAGRPLEIASAFSPEVLKADSRAFTALMRYIAEKDPDKSTVIMVQVENEIGMLENARDYSPRATSLYRGDVPSELTEYLLKNASALHPYILKRITGTDTKGTQTMRTLKDKLTGGGTWADLFGGDDAYTEEIFMAYHYALYVEQLAAAAKAIHDLPLYVNAALDSRGRRPGQYPSAGPLARLIDIWHAAAPHIDILSPDIYDDGFKDWASQYALPGNPLFIPEARCCVNSGVRAMYVIGEHKALGYSPFAIDIAAPEARKSIKSAYALLRRLEPLLTASGSADTWGLLLSKDDPTRKITSGDIVITASHARTLPWNSTDGPWAEGGGIIIRLGALDYIIAGSGVVATFATKGTADTAGGPALGQDGFAATGSDTKAAADSGRFTFKGKQTGIGYVDEVDINPDGSLKYLRRDNGDQTHQGRHVCISPGDTRILHVRLYEY